MSNVTVDKIVAISRDGDGSAITDDGINWAPSITDNWRWMGISYTEHKYAYFGFEIRSPLVMRCFSNINYTDWNGGVLPTPQLDCIVVVGRNVTLPVISYDGSLFSFSV